MKIKALLIPLIASSALVSSSSAATQMFGVAQDTTLIQNFANNNYGARTNVLLGATGGSQQRAGLIEFDVSGFAGQYSSITSASVKFTIDVTTSTTGTYQVNLLQDGNDGWIQGTMNGAAQTGSATWNHRVSATDQWLGGTGSNGGARLNPQDIYGSMGSMTFTAATDGDGTVKNVLLDPSSLPAAVDTWTEIFDKWTSGVNPGLQIYGGTGQWSVGSLENATVSKRPVLTIEYTPIPEPSGVALLGLGALGLVLRRRR